MCISCHKRKRHQCSTGGACILSSAFVFFLPSACFTIGSFPLPTACFAVIIKALFV